MNCTKLLIHLGNGISPFLNEPEKGMIPFSTPFDSTSVDFLEELNVDVYKIASFENKDWPTKKGDFYR